MYVCMQLGHAQSVPCVHKVGMASFVCVCVRWEGRSLAGLQMLYKLNVGRICVSAVKYNYEQPVSS